MCYRLWYRALQSQRPQKGRPHSLWSCSMTPFTVMLKLHLWDLLWFCCKTNPQQIAACDFLCDLLVICCATNRTSGVWLLGVPKSHLALRLFSCVIALAFCRQKSLGLNMRVHYIQCIFDITFTLKVLDSCIRSQFVHQLRRSYLQVVTLVQTAL